MSAARTGVVGGSLRSIIRGVAAGVVGTLALDAWVYLGYRRGGGDDAFPAWETSAGLDSWENAPAPALVAKKVLEVMLGHEVPPRYARALNDATHWGFGVANGGLYGLLVGS